LTNSLTSGETVYVVLEKRGEFHQVERASVQPIRDVSNSQVVLRGTSTYSWVPNARDVRIEYGLERYYVPEETGNPIGRLTVQVSVPNTGKGIIKQVLIDGKPYAEAMRDRIRR